MKKIFAMGVGSAIAGVAFATELFVGNGTDVAQVTYTNMVSGATEGQDYTANSCAAFPVIAMVADSLNGGMHVIRETGLAHYGWNGSIFSVDGSWPFPGGTSVAVASDGTIFTTQSGGLNSWTYSAGAYQETGYIGFSGARDVAIDPNSGVIHVLHDGGLSAFSYTGGTLATITGAWQSQVVNGNSIVIDANGNIFAGRDDGINALTFDGSAYTLGGWWGAANASDLSLASDGTLFATRTSGWDLDSLTYDGANFTQTGYLGGLGGGAETVFIDSENHIHVGKADGILEINYDASLPIVGALAIGDWLEFSRGARSISETPPVFPPSIPICRIDAESLYWSSTNHVVYAIDGKTSLQSSWQEITNGIAATPATNSLSLLPEQHDQSFFRVKASFEKPEYLQNIGLYFPKKEYVDTPLPIFQNIRDQLPQPIFDEDPDYVACYWKTWELAFMHFRKPPPTSPSVSNYIDEAFNPSLFLWDTVFMTMFCNYAHPYVPGIQSLDNFYCTQREDGEIVREISEASGEPNPAAEPGTPDSLNHPLLAWAELESYRISGDTNRLEMVFEPLVRYYYSYEKIRDPATGFYQTSWASMDNSPRIPGLFCGVDTTAEMVSFARDLSEIATVLNRPGQAEMFEQEASALASGINAQLWDEETGFYYDWTVSNEQHTVQTIGAYWTMRAGVPDPARQERMVAHLRDKNKFNRPHRVPTVPADESTYAPHGEYWRGSVWSPTTTMVVRGLQRNGYDALAKEIALNHLDNVVEVFRNTGTLWENYAPEAIEPGRWEPDGDFIRPDFVGWSGIAPILYLIEFAIGIEVDAPDNSMVWNVCSTGRVGVEKLWFNNLTVSLVCEPADENGFRAVYIDSDGNFTLTLHYGATNQTVNVVAGQVTISLPPNQ